MSKKIELENYYPGDAAWLSFVASSPEPLPDDMTELKNELSGDKDIAEIVWAIVGIDSLAWVRSPKEMLDGLAPAECFTSSKLKKRLRTMLMRMG